jgi:hypothetical protein
METKEYSTMRWALLLLAIMGTDNGIRPRSDFTLIGQFNDCAQIRFATPPYPDALGMSRMVVPASMGEHFTPAFNTTRDFLPENEKERRILADLESAHLQVGFYVFGRAILGSEAPAFSYRALKGPAAITKGTPRPALYPTAINLNASSDALPDWQTIYPLAQKAMKSFADGGSGFKTTLGSWNIATRPVLASQEKCVACHNSSPRFYSPRHTEALLLNQPLGGVIYAYRRSRT